MVVKSVTLYVKQQFLAGFIEATKENEFNSRKESGIVSFDFYQCQDDPTKFLLHEVYASKQAVEEHTATAHYKKWHGVIDGLLEKPTERVVYIPVD